MNPRTLYCFETNIGIESEYGQQGDTQVELDRHYKVVGINTYFSNEAGNVEAEVEHAPGELAPEQYERLMCAIEGFKAGIETKTGKALVGLKVSDF